jgi:hypothetical protein
LSTKPAASLIAGQQQPGVPVHNYAQKTGA